MTRVYLDHNATSVLRPEARDAMIAAMDAGGNPSSVHGEGREAKRQLDVARERVAGLVGVRPDMVVFTSGGTEANNLALHGAPVDRVIVAATEHPAILEAGKLGNKALKVVPVDGQGIIGLAALEDVLAADRRPALVSVMLANNETGVIQPIQEIVEIARKHDALVHTDAVQAAGKIDLSFVLLGVDMLSLTAHKFGGPQGAGALIVRDELALMPLVTGGGQELKRRGGTENVAAIAGFGAACTQAKDELAKTPDAIGALRDRLRAEIARVTPELCVFGGDAPRLPNTLCFAHPSLSAEMLLISFDLDGIAISSGSACSSGKVQSSHVLDAMGVDPELAKGAIRVSLGWNSTSEDIERFIEVWTKIAERHGARKAAG